MSSKIKKIALVLGYGSIGKRHANILSNMDDIHIVNVLTQQQGVPYPTVQSLDDITNIKPDYIVIASDTSRHLEQLKFFEKYFTGKIILIEKPLFLPHEECTVGNNAVYVGYNLRFHPVLQLIKKVIRGRKIWNIDVFCGSYLPDWRPERDYRYTYSANKDSGGGVLLDLSHEFDYVQWIAGVVTPDYVFNGKISDLRINSDDFLQLSGWSESGVKIQISLNYFTRSPVRRLIIDGEGISIQADLVDSDVRLCVDGASSVYSWDVYKDDTYVAQHAELLSDYVSDVCTFDEGSITMSLINRVKDAMESKAE